jgi:predicted RNase H-like HicB family nuclease
MQFNNTLQKGSVRTMIFKESDTWVGVVLDFNIVETGDDPQEVFLMLDEALRGYVISARKAKLRPHVLNQTPEKEYLDLWYKAESGKKIPSMIQMHSFGTRTLSSI